MKVQSPIRIARSYVQVLDGTPDQVFPLLCPVRETEWVAGWDPVLVLSHGGLAEPDCVFTTSDQGREAVWVVTDHDPAAHVVEMLKVVPAYTVTRLRIALRAAGPARTHAEVTYSWTALTPEGEVFVRERTEEAWTAFMREWEDELNAYLVGHRPGANQA